MRRSLAIALSLFFSLGLLAQMHDHAVPRAVTLEEGLGNEHFAVTTSNEDAQRFFDQGMRYVYAFNHDEAVRSFTHAGELDPNLAMAWWGSALALGPNINLDVDPDREKQAYDAVQTAQTKYSRASEKERDLIDALAKRYTNDPSADLHKLGEDYSHAMAAVAKKYPDDPDINTLYAESMMDLRPWKFWSHDGKPAEGTEEIVGVLHGVLKDHPNHIGANHYLIHAVEASPNPAEAVMSAQRLKTLAPSAGHLVHMPAHIYQRTGNYSGAAEANVSGAVSASTPSPRSRKSASTCGTGSSATTSHDGRPAFSRAPSFATTPRRLASTPTKSSTNSAVCFRLAIDAPIASSRRRRS